MTSRGVCLSPTGDTSATAPLLASSIDAGFTCPTDLSRMYFSWEASRVLLYRMFSQTPYHLLYARSACLHQLFSALPSRRELVGFNGCLHDATEKGFSSNPANQELDESSLFMKLVCRLITKLPPADSLPDSTFASVKQCVLTSILCIQTLTGQKTKVDVGRIIYAFLRSTPPRPMKLTRQTARVFPPKDWLAARYGTTFPENSSLISMVTIKKLLITCGFDKNVHFSLFSRLSMNPLGKHIIVALPPSLNSLLETKNPLELSQAKALFDELGKQLPLTESGISVVIEQEKPDLGVSEVRSGSRI